MIETDAAGAPVQVADLDADWLLALVEDADLDARRAERKKLRLAVRWCALHPADSVTDAARWDEGTDLAGERVMALGGDGTPLVAEFAVAPFAAALGVSNQAGARVLADALDLVHRLPHTWARVEALAVPAWRARRLAEATHGLPLEAARWVDGRLAGRVGTLGVATIEFHVQEALALFDPDRLAEQEAAAARTWGVRLRHPTGDESAGTSFLDATGATLDLTAFHDLLSTIADQLRTAGDDGDLDARKARALGVVAARAAAGLPLLDLVAGTSLHTGKVRLHVHLRSEDLTDPTDTTRSGTGTVERLGPATLDLIRTWLGTADAQVLPVLRMDRRDAVDAHDPPAWMRDLVVLRDRHCVFPHCRADARACDLDHIDPYDEHGPPGQTQPD